MANREINYELNANASGLDAGVAQAQKSFDKLDATVEKLSNSASKVGPRFSDITSVIKNVASNVKRFTDKVGGFVQEASDYIENVNLFQVAMGEYAEEASKYADTVQEKLGIDNSDWIRTQGTLMTLATGFGIASDAAADMSENMTKLSYDLASYYNLDFEKAQGKVRAGFTGQSRAMRDLGYDLTQAAINEQALALGIDKTAETMTQAEKAQLRYYIMMTHVTQAQGDLARTINAPANQLRLLQQQATLAARSLGNVLIPAINAVLPYVIAFVRVLTAAAQALANFFGFKMETVDYTGMASDLGVVEDAAGGIGDALDDAAGSGGKAAKAVKDLKMLIGGFDELNILPDEKDSSGGGGSGGKGVAGGGGGGGFTLPEVDYNNFLGQGIEDRITPIFEKMTETIKKMLPLLKTVAAILATIWTISMISKFVGWLDKLLGRNDSLVKSWNKARAAMLAFLASFAIGYLVTYIAVMKDMENGTMDFAHILTLVVVAIGAVIAIISILNASINGMFFGIGLIIGAIVGFIMACENVQEQATLEAFFSNEGAAITAYAEKVNSSNQAWIDMVQPVLNAKAALTTAREDINNTTSDIGLMLTRMQGAPEVTQGMVDALVAKTQELREQMHTEFEAISNTVITYLKTSMNEAVLSSIEDVDGLMRKIVEFENSMKSETDLIVDEIVAVQESMVGMNQVELDAANAELDTLYGKLENLSVTADEGANRWGAYVEDFNSRQLNFESEEAAKAALDGMAEKADEAKTAVLDAGVAAQTEFETLALRAEALGDMDNAVMFRNLAEKTKENTDIQVAQIEQDMQQVTDTIASSFTQQFDEALEANINNATWGDKFVAGLLSIFQGGSLGSYEEILYATSMKDTAEGLEGISEGIKTFAAKTNTSADLSGVGKDTINGYVTGLKQQIAKGEDLTVLGQHFKECLETPKSILDSHSDSKEMIKIGYDTIHGYETGMEKEMPQAIKLMQNSFDELLKVPGPYMQSFFDTGKNLIQSLINGLNSLIPTLRQTMSDMFKGVNIKMPHFKMSGSFNAQTGQTPKLNVEWYKEGGFPTTGALFVAGEMGPEMVGQVGNRTAVANNDQIVSAVSRGVAQAVAEVLSSGSGAGSNSGEQRIVLQVDGKVLGDIAIGRINDITDQTGNTPIEVY